MLRQTAPGTAHGVVAPVRTDPRGVSGPTRRTASGTGWRRSSQGLYVPADLELTPLQRVVEAGVLAPRYGGVTGWGSLAWQDGSWFTGIDADGELRPVDLANPWHAIRPQAGFHMTGERFNVHEAAVDDGIVVGSVQMSTFFEMRYARSVRDAGVVLSMAAYDDLVTVEEMDPYVDARPTYTGVQQARDAVARADENCWSPQEFRMLEEWQDLGFTRPLTNRPVFDLGGRHVGTPDLTDPVAGVIGQYHGGVHLLGDQPARDEAAEAAYEELGLVVVTARAGQLGGPRFERALTEAYAEAWARPHADRPWTMELPSWWVPTFTVEQRRALSPEDRLVWLRYRNRD